VTSSTPRDAGGLGDAGSGRRARAFNKWSGVAAAHQATTQTGPRGHERTRRPPGRARGATVPRPAASSEPAWPRGPLWPFAALALFACRGLWNRVEADRIVQNCKQVCLLIIERKNSSRSAYATTRSHTRALTACFEVECWQT
jgi:hypothetical protein